MLKRTEVLATMAATIAAGLLTRVYTDRDGHQQPSMTLEVVPRTAKALAEDILERIEADDRAAGFNTSPGVPA